MTLQGALIGESVRVGGSVEGVALRVSKVWRADVGDVDAGQPERWTFIEFEAATEDAGRLAAALSTALDSGRWYRRNSTGRSRRGARG
jgi:hypothetical protein